MEDFRRVSYESISMFLTRSYFTFVLSILVEFLLIFYYKIQESEEVHTRMIEKIDLERERILTVEDIILNINTFQKYISCEDLKSLYVSGVPNRFRSLYW